MLTALDTFVDEIAARIGRLPNRSLVALFWACSSALSGEYRNWSASVNSDAEPILVETLAAAHQFAAIGQEPAGKERLLDRLEAAVPPGDYRDKADKKTESAAQDCWICADVCIRVLVDADYDASPAIEYALEPVLHNATERLFGVTQVGSGPHEAAQVEAILMEPEVSRAIDFIQWAVDVLGDATSLSEDGLKSIAQRASVLQSANE